MAENRGVWGIDIGQAGLKAVRLRYAEAAEQVIAVAFDYVPLRVVADAVKLDVHENGRVVGHLNYDLGVAVAFGRLAFDVSRRDHR